MYGKINLDAVAAIAREEAPRHPALLAAGHFWAARLELDEIESVRFGVAFACHFVESILLTGRSMRAPFRLDIMGRPLTSQILIAVCSDLGIDPQRLPDNMSMHVTPTEVTWQRAGATAGQVWWADLGSDANVGHEQALERVASTAFEGNPLC